ncbi:hypothetical protein E0198_000835 [Clavispora lusitaniae]|nr:hypothetical protein E0198_000835 [Clavispora lusitaniae]
MLSASRRKISPNAANLLLFSTSVSEKSSSDFKFQFCSSAGPGVFMSSSGDCAGFMDSPGGVEASRRRAEVTARGVTSLYQGRAAMRRDRARSGVLIGSGKASDLISILGGKQVIRHSKHSMYPDHDQWAFYRNPWNVYSYPDHQVRHHVLNSALPSSWCETESMILSQMPSALPQPRTFLMPLAGFPARA